MNFGKNMIFEQTSSKTKLGFLGFMHQGAKLGLFVNISYFSITRFIGMFPTTTEMLSLILEGLQTLYRKSGRSDWGDALKVSKTGLTFLRTIVVIAGIDATLLPLNGHWLIIFCLTNFRARSIMFHPRTQSSKSLETFLQGKMCREGVKPHFATSVQFQGVSMTTVFI